MILPIAYGDQQNCHQGTMPNRAYYIPSSGHCDNLTVQWERSDRLQRLNGDWKCKYYASMHDLTERFYEPEFHAGDYDTILAPGVWQSRGCSQIPYPCPADAPDVPCDNPCGAYVHKFNYQKDEDAPKAFLYFEGADASFHVWLNGQYLGYDGVSCADSEFDVTDRIVDGENTLAVLVLKWRNGSSREDQEIFRTCGFFHDVYLLKRPDRHIRDYFISNLIDDEEAVVCIQVAFNEVFVPATIKLLNADNQVVAKGALKAVGSETSFTHQTVLRVKNPILWNPREPYLYTLLLECPEEVIAERVGIRGLCVNDNEVYLNGRAIRFRGVSRHGSDPAAGSVIRVEYTEQDLECMKGHKFKAVRISRRPSVSQALSALPTGTLNRSISALRTFLVWKLRR